MLAGGRPRLLEHVWGNYSMSPAQRHAVHAIATAEVNLRDICRAARRCPLMGRAIDKTEQLR